MIVDEKTIIKYLDVVILKSKDISRFNAFTTLSDILDFDNKNNDEKNDFFSLTDSVQRIGITYKYFEELENEINIFRLTKEGIRAKEIGGHLKYQKSLKKKPMSNFEIAYLLLTIIIIGFNVYQGFQNKSLRYDFDSLKSQFDSLKHQLENDKDSIVDLKAQVELYKVRSLNDTLQSKNYHDLKTD